MTAVTHGTAGISAVAYALPGQRRSLRELGMEGTEAWDVNGMPRKRSVPWPEEVPQDQTQQ